MTESPASARARVAAAGSTGPSPEAPRRPALSPSRAADFKQCPLLYRFRAIDRLAELPTRAQVRTIDLSEPGTYVFLCNLPGHFKSGMYATVTVG